MKIMYILEENMRIKSNIEDELIDSLHGINYIKNCLLVLNLLI